MAYETYFNTDNRKIYILPFDFKDFEDLKAIWITNNTLYIFLFSELKLKEYIENKNGELFLSNELFKWIQNNKS